MEPSINYATSDNPSQAKATQQQREDSPHEHLLLHTIFVGETHMSQLFVMSCVC